MLAWLFAHHTGREFLVRVEDIDTARARAESETRQLEDLAALGITWVGEPLKQQHRSAAYQAALDSLPTYECFCSRKDIVAAASAPHVPPGHYPGTCRNLTEAQREAKRAEFAAAGRLPAIRLAAQVSSFTITDYYAGTVTCEVDDFILRRGAVISQGQQPDWAYNLAVVVDDGYQRVDQVVRGDDLLSSAGRQAYLAELLGLAIPEYVHVPLVLGKDGKRLSKRDGAITLRQLAGEELDSVAVARVFSQLAASIGVPHVGTMEELAARFNPQLLPREPYIFHN